MSISPISAGSQNAFEVSQLQSSQDLPGDQALQTKEAFQDFVAGTFFKMMLKSLRSTQGEVAYIGGGQAEQSFRGQLDQQIAEDLAREHGDAFAAPLYPNFRSYLDKKQSAEGVQLDHLA